MTPARSYYLSLAGAVLLTVAAFLPWVRIGSVGLRGYPDPAALFIIGLGAVGIVLSAIGMATRRDTRQGLLLIGLAGVTTLLVVWMTGPSTVADRAQARAEAVALVDNVAVQPVPPVTVGIGVFTGLAAAAAVAVAGVTHLASGRD